MKEFKYTITNPEGIHARPAGMFVKAASACLCNVTITKGDKEVDVKKIFAVLGLAVKCNEEIMISLDGVDEYTEAVTLENFMQDNL